MKLLKILFCVILCSAVISGCAPGKTENNFEQNAAGGTDTNAEHINLKDISITQNQSETVIKFSFLTGSRINGYAEKKLTQTPKYEISILDNPWRIKIKFEGIDFWDYEITNNGYPDYIASIFKVVPAKDNSLEIYIQLKKEAYFTSPTEEEGSLSIGIVPVYTDERSRYFYAVDAFLEHQEGRFPAGLGLHPVLCADLTNIIMISQPFELRDQAETNMQNALSVLKEYSIDKKPYIVCLPGGALPEFEAGADFSFLEKRKVVQKGGKDSCAALLLENGRYLCSAPDGRIAFVRNKTAGQLLGDDESETLWIRQPNDRIQALNAPEFFSVQKAAFSYDGRYIGILDVSVENSVLYVYDFSTEMLYNLGEEGFGGLVDDFAWADSNNAVYASSYEGLIKYCAFGQENLSVAVKDKWPAGQGKLEVSKGRIFFAHHEKESIYLLNDGITKLTKGIDFRVSPDGAKLVVLEKQETKNERVLTGLKLYDIETGKEKVVANEADITNFSFSSDAGRVYYTAQYDDEQFGFALYAFDVLSGTLKKAALCSTAQFFAAGAPTTLYFVDYVDHDDNRFFTTYICDISE